MNYFPHRPVTQTDVWDRLNIKMAHLGGEGTVCHNDDNTYAVRKLVNRGPGDKMCSKRLGVGISIDFLHFWNSCW